MFLVNEPALDWLTLTTYDSATASAWRDMAKAESSVNIPTKRLQYSGSAYMIAGGSTFVGAARQRGDTHYMAVWSGRAAVGAIKSLAELTTYALNARCTRLDVQLTIPVPDGWSQWGLFNRIKRDRPHVLCQYMESDNPAGQGTLATVATGSRSSERFVRVYIKPSLGEELYLRFETEFKGGLADRAYGAIRADALGNGEYHGSAPASAGDLLKAELEKYPDRQLARHMLAGMENFNPYRLRYVKQSSKTREWLLQTVAPALEKFLSASHDDDDIRTAFLEILTRGMDPDAMGDAQ